MRKALVVVAAIIFSVSFILEAKATLVGVDFGPGGQQSPSNWTSVSAEGTYNNLMDENGNITDVSLVVTDSIGTAYHWAAAVDPTTIPSHSNSLADIGGNLYSFDYPSLPELELQFTSLESGTVYDVWVFGVRDGYFGMSQDVTIAGQGAPITFAQIADSQKVFVNDSLGSNSQNLSAYAKSVTSTAGGTININIVGDVVESGYTLYAVAGVAIEPHETPPPAAIPTLSEWGMIILSVLLALTAVVLMRRQRMVN